MAAILAFPFRLNPDGTVATVTQSTDQANAEQIAVLVSTIVGEREMVPGYGLPDPAYSGVQPGMIQAKIAMFGPAVTVAAVTTFAADDTHVDIQIGYQ